MKYSRPNKNFLRLSIVLLTLAFSSRAIAQILYSPTPLVAQAASPAFPLPSSVPAGTTVKLDGSSTMTVINEALKQRFEQEFSGSKVETATGGTEGALQALLDGKIDVVAIGRSLTPEEQGKGLVEAPISREKIAIITSPENPFKGDISFVQFAKIFRGEITDWAELGGAPGPIRVVDRPDSNDTRLSLSKYKVFADASFATGSNTTKLTEDDVASVVKELGKDGISYAIASQVLNQPNVHIVSMHKTLPNDPRYPYSQPRGYVYNKNASPAVQAFLGFAASPAGQEAVKAAKAKESTALAGAAVAGAAITAGAAAPSVSPDAAANASPSASISPDISPNTSSNASPDPTATGDTTALLPATDGGVTTTQDTNLGWLWWLLLPLLAGLFWWIFKRDPLRVTRRDRRPVEESMTGVTPPREIGTSSIASREVDLGTAGVTPPRPSMSNPPAPPAMPNISTPNLPTGSVPPVPKPDLGKVAGMAAVGAAGVAGAAGMAGSLADRWKRNRMTLTPSDRQLNVAWDVPADHEADVQQQGGQKKLLRLYDVTNVDLERQAPNSVKLFDCNDTSKLTVPLEVGDRDYIGELGYTTPDNRWMKLARSARIHVPKLPEAAGSSTVANPNTGTNPNIGATVLGGAAAAAAGIAGMAAATRPAGDKIVNPPDEVNVPANDSSNATVNAAITPERSTVIQPEAADGAAAPMNLVGTAGTVTDLNPAIALDPDRYDISTLKVNSRANCFVLNPQQMQRLQNEVGVSKALEPGNYIIRLKSGSFSYRTGTPGEPLVMLWIYGGRVMNLQTQVPVQATWSTLNGYDDSLHLQVIEPATLCAFFFDTHLGDNEGDVLLTTTKL